MNLSEVAIIEVIRTTLTRRGAGKDKSDPIRVVTQFWSRDGELLAEVDPCMKLVPITDEDK